MEDKYIPMVGCDTALTWVENLKDVDPHIQQRVLARMSYAFRRDIPVKPKFHKGKNGKRYDYYTCGQCGSSITLPIDEYCSKCGYAIDKKEWWRESDGSDI